MRAATRAIIIVGDQLLLMHRQKFGQEYYTLLGGGLSPGETLEQSVAREVMEESGFRVTAGRLVFIEKAGIPYGTQHVFLCEASGTKPQLWEKSEEAKINELGQNIHTPVLVPIKTFASLPFRSEMLKTAILYGLSRGFPEQPVELDPLYVQDLQQTLPPASPASRVQPAPVATPPATTEQPPQPPTPQVPQAGGGDVV